MLGLLAKPVAKILSFPPVANWIISKYTTDENMFYHLPGYMHRWWLFNPRSIETNEAKYPWIPFSIRLHHILRKDNDRHLHSHPFNARTFIIKSWYIELRENGKFHVRQKGSTAYLSTEDFHAIVEVPHGGVWTIFVCGKREQDWGFLVGGKVVTAKEYLQEHHRNRS